MKTIKTLLLFLFVIGMTQSGNTQFLKELKKEVAESAKKAIKKKSKQETEKKVESAMDSVLNPTLPKRKKKGDEEAEATEEEEELSGFESLLKPGKTESSYTFDLKADTRIITYGRKKDDTTKMVLSYGENASSMQPTSAPNSMLIITDWKNESSVVLNQEDRTGQIVNMSAFNGLIAKRMKKEEQKQEEFTFEKSTQTKTICGYKCVLYIAETDDTRTELWYAPEVKFDLAQMRKSFAQMGNMKVDNYPNQNGYLMEMTSYHKGEKQMNMLVTKINTDPYTIDVSNFTFN